MEKWLWKRLWACRKQDSETNEGLTLLTQNGFVSLCYTRNCKNLELSINKISFLKLLRNRVLDIVGMKKIP
jgi:hypothetical protein